MNLTIFFSSPRIACEAITSSKSALHVESPWIVSEVFRPGFFCPIVQLANMFANDEIVALASDILAA